MARAQHHARKAKRNHKRRRYWSMHSRCAANIETEIVRQLRNATINFKTGEKLGARGARGALQLVRMMAQRAWLAYKPFDGRGRVQRLFVLEHHYQGRFATWLGMSRRTIERYICALKQVAVKLGQFMHGKPQNVPKRLFAFYRPPDENVVRDPITKRITRPPLTILEYRFCSDLRRALLAGGDLTDELAHLDADSYPDSQPPDTAGESDTDTDPSPLTPTSPNGLGASPKGDASERSAFGGTLARSASTTRKARSGCADFERADFQKHLDAMGQRMGLVADGGAAQAPCLKPVR